MSTGSAKTIMRVERHQADGTRVRNVFFSFDVFPTIVHQKHDFDHNMSSASWDLPRRIEFGMLVRFTHGDEMGLHLLGIFFSQIHLWGPSPITTGIRPPLQLDVDPHYNWDSTPITTRRYPPPLRLDFDPHYNWDCTPITTGLLPSPITTGRNQP